MTSIKQEDVEHEFVKEEEKEFEFQKAEGTSKKRKTIDVEESSHNSIGLQSTEPLKQGVRPPRRKRAVVQHVIAASERDAALCLDAALSHLNEKSLAEQGPEYELVERRACIRHTKPITRPTFHCNFTARPKNGSEAETKLFMADLKFKIVTDKDSKKPKAIPVVQIMDFMSAKPVGFLISCTRPIQGTSSIPKK